jgi:hypothetical protein
MKKIVFVFMMIAALLALQVGAVYAAPALQATTIDGTVKTITQSTDGSGNTIFVVEVEDANHNTQTVRISADTAVQLGLVTDNGDGTYTINPTAAGMAVSIDSGLVLADPCTLPEGSDQPVAAALTRFFCGGLGIDYTTLEGLHTEGFGFGEIAQACFMAEALGGDAKLCGDFLAAKKSHDFSTLASTWGFPDTVKNWGQLKKYVMSEELKSLTNLGAIMSGRATPGTLPLGTHGHGHGNGNGHGHGHKP